MEQLEQWMGLHEWAEIIYVVDGFEVTLLTEGEVTASMGWGASIPEAVQDAMAGLTSGMKRMGLPVGPEMAARM